MRGGYEVYVMLQLAQAFGFIDTLADYETAWKEATKLYDTFNTSSFNRPDIDMQEGITGFLESKEDESER